MVLDAAVLHIRDLHQVHLFAAGSDTRVFPDQSLAIGEECGFDADVGYRAFGRTRFRQILHKSSRPRPIPVLPSRKWRTAGLSSLLLSGQGSIVHRSAVERIYREWDDALGRKDLDV